jgi:glycerol-3-phosphate dehydrogenase
VTSRERVLDEVDSQDRPWDLVVVGGGATGLGIAVDAASRGHRTLLLERQDFAQGTSSRSTKLVHGGVRYLRQGRISLVREALEERGRLLRNAPHLVRPLDFVIPAYRWTDTPWYGLGLAVYDHLAGQHRLARSERLSRERALALVPTLAAAGLRGGVRFADAQFDDARLAIHLAMTADELGARVLNYCEVVRLVHGNGRVRGVVAIDGETGRERTIEAKAVINATGVFVDALRRLDEPASETLVTPSQGAHVVLPREFLPGDAALLVPRTSDGRVLFAIPWHDRVVLGTTDTPVGEPVREPQPLAAEIDFLLEHAARYLTRAPAPCDVRSTFAGLRPLVRRASERSTSALSRDHTIVVSPAALVSVTGGKWTTYRRMAQEVLDRAEEACGLDRRPCRTADLRLHGGENGRELAPPLDVYGADASRLREIVAAEPELSERLVPELPMIGAQVAWAARAEMARTLEDVLARRTRALVLDARASLAAAPRVARILARELGHDEAWIERSLMSYREVVARHLP